jgi:dihydrofolate reductase
MANADVELVVAVSENNVIGRANQLPWRLSGDLRHFKSLTMGHRIFMGRKTYESIGRALPGRVNCVLSRSPDFAPADCRVVRTLREGLVGAAEDTPLMVIGGAEIYRLCLPFARRIHLTLVHAEIKDGDTYFDEWRGPEWSESSRERHPADDKNVYDYSFLTLDRVTAQASAS